jgi:hypothetical protein
MQLDLISRATPLNNWLILPVLILIILLIFFKNQKRDWLFLVKSYFSYYYFRQLEKDENFNQEPQNTIKFISSVLLISTTCYLCSLNQEKSYFFQVLTGFISFNFIYYISTVLSGFFFNKRELFNEYWFFYRHFINSIAIILTPFIFYLIFYPINSNDLQVGFNLFSALLIVLITLFSSRVINVFKKGLQLEVSLFHLILYLCTLEILPLLGFIWVFNLEI